LPAQRISRPAPTPHQVKPEPAPQMRVYPQLARVKPHRAGWGKTSHDCVCNTAVYCAGHCQQQICSMLQLSVSPWSTAASTGERC